MSTYGLPRSPALRPTDAGPALPVTDQPGAEWRRRGGRGRERPADRVLVGRVRRGDAEAFETIFRRYQTPLLSYCRHMLGNPDEAEDAVQQAFIRAHRGLVSASPPRELRPWLYTIARNCCHSAIARRRPVDDLDHHEPQVAGLADAVRDREDLRDLVRDVQALPEDQRSALLLAELGDLSQDEIARVVQCPPKKVKALIHQARTTLIAQREARETPCEEIRAELSIARGGRLRRGPLRRHLSLCAGCREYAYAVSAQRGSLAVALPVLPTAGLAVRVLGHTAAGAVGAVGGGIGGAAGVSGSASSIAASTTGVSASASSLAASTTGVSASASSLAAGSTGAAFAPIGAAGGTGALAAGVSGAAGGTGALAAGVSGAGPAGAVLGGGLAAKLAIGGAVAAIASAGAAVTLTRHSPAPLRPTAAQASRRVVHAAAARNLGNTGSKPAAKLSTAELLPRHTRPAGRSKIAARPATRSARVKAAALKAGGGRAARVKAGRGGAAARVKATGVKTRRLAATRAAAKQRQATRAAAKQRQETRAAAKRQATRVETKPPTAPGATTAGRPMTRRPATDRLRHTSKTTRAGSPSDPASPILQAASVGQALLPTGSGTRGTRTTRRSAAAITREISATSTRPQRAHPRATSESAPPLRPLGARRTTPHADRMLPG